MGFVPTASNRLRLLCVIDSCVDHNASTIIRRGIRDPVHWLRTTPQHYRTTSNWHTVVTNLIRPEPSSAAQAYQPYRLCNLADAVIQAHAHSPPVRYSQAETIEQIARAIADGVNGQTSDANLNLQVHTSVGQDTTRYDTNINGLEAQLVLRIPVVSTRQREHNHLPSLSSLGDALDLDAQKVPAVVPVSQRRERVVDHNAFTDAQLVDCLRHVVDVDVNQLFQHDVPLVLDVRQQWSVVVSPQRAARLNEQYAAIRASALANLPGVLPLPSDLRGATRVQDVVVNEQVPEHRQLTEEEYTMLLAYWYVKAKPDDEQTSLPSICQWLVGRDLLPSALPLSAEDGDFAHVDEAMIQSVVAEMVPDSE